MKVLTSALMITLLTGVIGYAQPVAAAFSTALWLSDKPATVTFLNPEYIVGTTEAGLVFSQYRIMSTAEIRIHKFVMDDNYFYIFDRGILTASSDLEAVSIYLTLT